MNVHSGPELKPPFFSNGLYYTQNTEC